MEDSLPIEFDSGQGSPGLDALPSQIKICTIYYTQYPENIGAIIKTTFTMFVALSLQVLSRFSVASEEFDIVIDQ